MKKPNHTGRRILIACILFCVIILTLGFTASTVGAISVIGEEGQSLPEAVKSADVPPTVIEDAANVSNQLLGKYDSDFANELLDSYIETKNKDLVILFNPGGWGEDSIDTFPGWKSILEGIQSELTDYEMDSLVIIYQRTLASLQGQIGEIVELFRGYSSKAETLACRIQFLTTHNPDLKVILTAESLGTLISEKVMSILPENPQIFSILTGTPPWYPDTSDERILVINDNGATPDSFSEGDITEILRANLLGLAEPSEKIQTDILKRIVAPGHDYSWDYPAISSQITQFLKEKVGLGD